MGKAMIPVQAKTLTAMAVPCCTGMARRRANSTRYDNRNRKLSWRVEWCFESAGVKEVNEHVQEDTPLLQVCGWACG